MKIQKQIAPSKKNKSSGLMRNSLLDTGFILGVRKQGHDPLKSYRGGDYNKYSKMSSMDDGDEDVEDGIYKIDCIECDNVVKPVPELKCNVKGCLHHLCLTCFKKKNYHVKMPWICDVCKSESREIRRSNENMPPEEQLESLDVSDEARDSIDLIVETSEEEGDGEDDVVSEYSECSEEDPVSEIIEVETDFDSDFESDSNNPSE